ncbi:hypothetical protein GEV33_011011 [Tenebrio molitor]|uniref:Uncharacterized protein n=1 Tax=Tenebrio molitor TaxID=7067 RepID=A0A8J6HCM7_TENMO|nr:hypothetical protein GEV33_011011 [Tenebrio molitor]
MAMIETGVRFAAAPIWAPIINNARDEDSIASKTKPVSFGGEKCHRTNERERRVKDIKQTTVTSVCPDSFYCFRCLVPDGFCVCMQIRRCLGQRRRKVTIFDRLKLHVHDLLDTPPDNGNKSRVAVKLKRSSQTVRCPLLNFLCREICTKNVSVDEIAAIIKKLTTEMNPLRRIKFFMWRRDKSQPLEDVAGRADTGEERHVASIPEQFVEISNCQNQFGNLKHVIPYRRT